MSIHYTFSKENLSEEKLEKLFLSVNWESGKHPEKLYQAIQGSHSVVTAWDGDRLVGLANALSDGALTAYFHYVLTDPSYQGIGIGKELMNRMLEEYKGYETKVLIAYPEVIDFYKKLGFRVETDYASMYISGLV